MNTRFIRMTGLGLALMLAAAACSGEASVPTPTDPPTAASTSQPTTVAPTTVTTAASVTTEPATTQPATSEATELAIEAVDNEGFSRTKLTAPAGQISLTFNNKDNGGEAHNWKVVIDDDVSFETGIAVGPDVQTVTFTIGTPGDYTYICIVHPIAMTGVLTVTP